VIKTQAINEQKGTVLVVTGRMDNVTSAEFEAACDNILQKNAKVLVLDLSELTYISSAGLRSVLSVAKKFKASGGKVLICGLTKMVKDVFQISGFSGIFPIFDSREAALAAA